MEKEFVTIDLALRLKALGFKERVLTYYEDGKPKLYTAIEGWDFNNSFLTCVSRPTYSQAFEWFRDKHDLHPYIITLRGEWIVIGIIKCSNAETITGSVNINFSSLEEAELACLVKLIEIVESKT